MKNYLYVLFFFILSTSGANAASATINCNRIYSPIPRIKELLQQRHYQIIESESDKSLYDYVLTADPADSSKGNCRFCKICYLPDSRFRWPALDPFHSPWRRQECVDGLRETGMMKDPRAFPSENPTCTYSLDLFITLYARAGVGQLFYYESTNRYALLGNPGLNPKDPCLTDAEVARRREIIHHQLLTVWEQLPVLVNALLDKVCASESPGTAL